jgi:hypothetical protein
MILTIIKIRNYFISKLFFINVLLTIKVLYVQIRHERTFYLFSKVFIYLNLFHPRMLKYLSCPSIGSQSKFRIFHKESSNKVFNLCGKFKLVRKSNLRVSNMILSFSISKVGIIKRRTPNKYLIKQSAHTIQIHPRIILVLINNLRRHILNTATVRISLMSYLFSQTKIC